jgi:hypothetical protein
VIQAVISGYTTEREIIDAPLLEEPERRPRLDRIRARFRRDDQHGRDAEIPPDRE